MFYVLKIYRILPVPLGTLIFVAPFLYASHIRRIGMRLIFRLSVAVGGIAWTAVLRGAESVGAAVSHPFSSVISADVALAYICLATPLGESRTLLIIASQSDRDSC